MDGNHTVRIGSFCSYLPRNVYPTTHKRGEIILENNHHLTIDQCGLSIGKAWLILLYLSLGAHHVLQKNIPPTNTPTRKNINQTNCQQVPQTSQRTYKIVSTVIFESGGITDQKQWFFLSLDSMFPFSFFFFFFSLSVSLSLFIFYFLFLF